jgi:hypothetical protein
VAQKDEENRDNLENKKWLDQLVELNLTPIWTERNKYE